jgi:transposase
MSHSSTLAVGRDVHHDAIAVADVAQEPAAEVISLGTIGTRQADMAQRIRPLPSTAQHLVCVYAAGPWGDWRSRDLTNKGQGCGVVAPSLLPKTAGDRVTTARRDAIQLARLRRAGDRSPGSVPTGEDAAIRALTRARAEAIHEVTTAKVRLNALLLRHDIRDPGRAAWGPAPRRWRSAGVCPPPAPQMVFQASGRAVNDHTARLQRLEQARPGPVHTWRLPPVVEALHALRGVQCTGAVTRVAELGDLTRCDHPRQLMTDLGLLPSAYASGERRRQGALTTAGTTPARRVRVDGAWAYRSPAQVSRPLPRRLEPLPKPLQDSSWTAQVRLCQRSRHLMARGQHANQVVVAIARALVGLLWAMATHVPVTDAGHQPNHHATNTSGGLPRCLGSDAAPVWCHPRRREDTGRHPRASSEAGTRRTHVRWDPPHG